MYNSMRSECDSSRPDSAWSEAESEREKREWRGEAGGRRANNGGARKTSGHETDLARAVTEIFKLDSEIN